MAENAKDTKKQAALREQIEHHPIWNYPPEERLQHNREWQQLYLLVFQFKEFLSKIENRLENTDTNAMLQDEDALLDARYTRRSKLRTKLDTLTFTESMCKAVSKYDVNCQRHARQRKQQGNARPGRHAPFAPRGPAVETPVRTVRKTGA